MSPAGTLPEDWRRRSYLALDFETTGLDAKSERVVEIGAIRFRPVGEGIESAAALASLVDPGKSMPEAVRAIHGISDEDLYGAPRFPDLAAALLSMTRGAIIIAHNARFDLSFLAEELARMGLAPGAPEALDTRLLAKAAFPGMPSYSLGNLAAAFRLEAGAAHRALDDAATCMRLFVLCARRLETGPRALAASGAERR
ncbi:MAG: 3'-5' exonuclease [Treponema sp.]|nr:3'-5' exonuclease [Treponema sp.]